MNLKRIVLSAALALGLAGGAKAAQPLQSTLTLPATTTAYTANQLIASNATPASIVVPFFTLPSGNAPFAIQRLRLSTNDATSTAWPAKPILIDLWSAAPTFNNGDRGAFSVKTGSGAHLGQFTCTMSAENTDGAYCESVPGVGTQITTFNPSAKIYWSLQAGSGGSGVTGASGVFTLNAEVGK